MLRGCRFVITQDERRRVLENVDILIEDGVISRIGEARSKDGLVLDCSRAIVMPALADMHSHIAMVAFRGYYDDAEPETWLERIWHAERRLTPEVVRLASELAVMELLSGGVGLVVDMHLLPEVTAEVAEKLGIRIALGPVFLDAMRAPEEVSREVRAFSARYRGRPLVKPILNVYSVYACSRETLEEAASLAGELGLQVHIHVSETRREIFWCKRRYGKFPVEILAELGLLRRGSLLAHLGWVASWELKLISEAGAIPVHCPASCMKLATAGFFPFKELIEMGVPVCIGTDGPAANNTLDMFREMRLAVLLQRHSYWDVRVRAQDALDAATINGYGALGIDAGRIVEGAEADIVVLDAESIAMLPLRRDNVVSAVVYACSRAEVLATIVAGRLVYSREWLSRWRERASQLAKKLNEFIEGLGRSSGEPPHSALGPSRIRHRPG